jgi:ferredoxin
MENNKLNKPDAREVKRVAADCGIDLAGIASIDRFDAIPENSNPKSILPHAMSVIAFGHRIPRGSLSGPETGKAFHTLSMNSPITYAVTKTYRFCCELESRGWESVPLYPHSRDVRDQGVPVAEGRAAPDVALDVEYAAHAAGLGEMGKGWFFLTPEFGLRQFFTFVVTDLALEPDAPLEENSICDNCGACAAACPAGALKTEEPQKFILCQKPSDVYELRIENCRVCPMTASLSPPYASGKEPWRLGASCARACVARLEDGGKLTRSFHSPFRRQLQGEE